MYIWEKFSDLFRTIKDDHEKFGLLGGGHDIYHAARVAQRAHEISLAEWGDERLAELAGMAGLCHNADHIVTRRDKIEKHNARDESVHALLQQWLSHADTSSTENMAIISAVIGHTGKNSDSDSRTLIALMDADRVVNMEADVIMRAGQFYNDIPAVDHVYFLNNPNATYRKPSSVARDIAYCLDWVDADTQVCVRTKLGKKLGNERAQFLRNFFQVLEMQLKTVGLLPSPF